MPEDESGKTSPDSIGELRDEWREIQRRLSTWNFYIGRVGFSAEFNSMRFARYFVGFHVLVGIMGGALIFTAGPARELGMALVVGALFGLGAFIAQVWSTQVSTERWLVEDELRTRIATLHTRFDLALENQSPVDPED